MSNVDVFGPQVTAQSPTGTVAAPVSSFQVTFNEAMDPATFTAADVTVTGPAGNAVALAADNPIVDSGDHQTFTINFACASRWREPTRSRWGRTCGTWRATG